MTGKLPSRVLKVTIARSAGEVYDFASQPEQMWQWASGLGAGLCEVNGVWQVDTTGGMARVRFTPHNDQGILDHEVTLADGTEIRVPMRVVPLDAQRCEVQLTLFRTPGMSAAQLAADAEWVMHDLTTLKRLMETGRADGRL